jgi:hypothetical protein
MRFFRRHHVEKLVKMTVMPAGIDPSGRLVRVAGGLIWRLLTRRVSGPALRPG